MLSLETLGFYSDAEGSQRYPWPLGLLYPSKGDFVAFVGLVSSRPFVRRTVADFRALAPFRAKAGPRQGSSRASTGRTTGPSHGSGSRR